MSGWAAMVRFDDAPLDRALFDTMTESLRFRGPDRTGTWIGTRAAFAHTLFTTRPSQRDERQPLAIGEIVLTGDFSIDIPSAGIESLLGDFSLAIWNERERMLTLARDRFARRPLFVARHAGAVLATNNLPTLLAIPGLANELDERAIADFLLFGRNLDARRTTFANIERIPAAHIMTISAHATRLRRYWTIPPRSEPRRIKPAEVYAEFRDLLGRAVADRAVADRVVISLSGGLDSNAIAAMLARVEPRPRITALTTVWSEVNDAEGTWAAIAANEYGFAHEILPIACDAFEGWDDPRVRGWEPTDEPCTLPFFDFVRRAASHARVVLTGEGGDPLLYASHDHFFRLLTRLHWVRLVSESVGYAITRRRRPPLNLRSQLQLAFGHTPGLPPYPSWINRDLEHRLDLRARWSEVLATGGPRRHAYRHDAWRILDSPAWSRQFEASDPGTSGQPLEWLSPYLDVRVVEFLFSLPPMPHFANKDLVRQALRGWMPDAIRTRPKTALPGDPAAIRFAGAPQPWLDAIGNGDELDRYVDRRVLCSAIREGGTTQYQSSQQAFAVSLALWLAKRNA